MSQPETPSQTNRRLLDEICEQEKELETLRIKIAQLETELEQAHRRLAGA